MRFEYWNTADGTWAWQLTSVLGEVLARGTPSGSREDCLASIKLVKLAAGAGCHNVTVPMPLTSTGVDNELLSLRRLSLG